MLSGPAVNPAPPSRRALVVEDDEEMRALVVGALREDGLLVDEAENGRLMWMQTIVGPAYDLIVSDVRLPILDGLTVIEDLRGRGARTPVIVMTAFADEAARARAASLDVVLLDKPFLMGDLRAAVRRLFERASPKGQIGEHT